MRIKPIIKGAAVAAAGVSAYLFCSPYKKNIVMIGHRGLSAKYLENTERAFIEAAKNGSGGIETDVRITKDGVFVLNHNPMVNYKDGTHLVIADSTYAELSAKPLWNPHSNEDIFICTFKRYLEICKEFDLVAFIEVKGEFPDEKLKEMFEMASQIHSISRCSLQSFNTANLDKARSICPELSLMLTYEDKNVDWNICLEKGYDIDMEYTLLTRGILKKFHEHGLKVGVWTVNDPFVLSWMRWYDLDYIESDIFGS